MKRLTSLTLGALLCAAFLTASGGCNKDRDATKDVALRCENLAQFESDLSEVMRYAKKDGIPFDKGHLIAAVGRINNWKGGARFTPDEMKTFCGWKMKDVEAFGKTGKLPKKGGQEPAATEEPAGGW